MSTFSPHGRSFTETDIESDRGRRGRIRRDDGAGRVDEAPPVPIDSATPIEIDLTVDPPRVRTAAAPSPQVFSGAARYRPVIVSLVLAAAIVVGYGVVVLASVLFDGVSPDTSPFDSAAPDRTIVASRGSLAEPGRCEEVSGRVFVDGDGNAIADPWDPDHDYDGIEVMIETDTGRVATLPVGADGSWSLDLDAPASASVAVVDLTGLADAGLWPGPRLLDEAGEAPIIGETCTLDLGLVWKPVGATAPLVGPIGAHDAAVAPVAEAPTEASGWRAGIQVHGRIWVDGDGDGRFEPSEQGVSGATVRLTREDGSLAAVATTGTDGTYALSNLRPNATYTVSVVADDAPTVVRAMGEAVETDDPARVRIDTSVAGMSVWGLDFGIGEAPTPVTSAGNDLGDAERRDRNGS